MIPTQSHPAKTSPGRISVSENQRHLVRGDGTPFFYLADTAWLLFHALDREDADFYLRTRATQGFTVIQAVVLAEWDGLRRPNAYGDLPLEGDDPARTVEAYFRHVDWIVARANELGLVVAMLPTWGDKWIPMWVGLDPVIFTPENAGPYGEWIGKRYRDADLIWAVGGDRPIQDENHLSIVRAMAEGLRRGDGGEHLITMHPDTQSGKYVHQEPWLDFNMMQSGHGQRNTTNWVSLTEDYARTPPKPCMDAEPCYENHPVMQHPEEERFDDWDVRKACWWGLFAGGHGHTYGCHDVWIFNDPAKGRRTTHQRARWQSSIHLPGASQMQHARALIESRPMLQRIPDQELIAGESGIGAEHMQACRAEDGSYAFIYSPSGSPIPVAVERLSGERLRASWYNPRTGHQHRIAVIARSGVPVFTPPRRGDGCDWVLVLDDEAKNYPEPGKSAVVPPPPAV